ncbi:hypothetical protein KQI30_07305 [Clostridium bornimense]|uniref:hypothetical protein n=1 Tax=Clostridium bornimense TaxID=1216932 RepID=UPI001C11379A|nr:hypothetical protein [Clostridium bornimense]MBU5316075.1 hypothetical protein [Clostridium bornimense]
MKCFGIKNVFAIEYELYNSNNGSLEVWVDNKSVCNFLKDGEIYKYKWDLVYVIEWLCKNKDNIINEIGFPLQVKAETSIEFYNKSGEFDSDDADEFDEWFEKRQEWYFRHSWYSNRGGSYLPDILFRRVNDKIEVEWDNSVLYDGINFINPKGIYYVDISLFQQVINGFVEDFFIQISNYTEGNKILEKLNQID